MTDAGITVNDLTDVVFTGGINKTPFLRKLIENHFQGRHIQRPDNYHDLSAMGAALECGIVMGIDLDD